MSAELIRLTGVGKRYPLVHRNADRMRALASLLIGRGHRADIAVLQGIDLTVRRGESVGIIGENGAGKSTLLKVLTGVLNASEGTVAVNGSVGALLELGAGFHPEYSGRENIATAAALKGRSGEDIRAKTASIIEFADIGRYIDEPIKHYSTGMVVRLGFAIVAARRPDLLITDEVLAVGDESFQKKCVRWIEEFIAGGGTLLLVSHSMYHVQKLCQHALWLHHGTVQAYGEVFEITQAYLAYHERKTAKEAEEANAAPSSEGYRVATLSLNGQSGLTPVHVGSGRDLRLELDIYSPDGRRPHVAVGIVRADGTAVYGTSSEIDAANAVAIDPSHYRYQLQFDAIALLPGQYSVKVHAMDPECMRVFDSEIREIVVRGETREFGLMRMTHRWSP